MKNLLALLLLIHASPALAGWTGEVNSKHLVSPGLASIAYSPRPEGEATFKDALDALARAGPIRRLEVVTLHWLVEDAAFQKQLMSALQASAPRELSEALRSEGNIHNPKMIQLRKPFEAAVLATPIVKGINSELSRYRLQVSGVSTEKLSLAGSGDRRALRCFLWLEVSALRPNHSFNAKPPRG